MKYEIIDNFLDPSYYNLLAEHFLGTTGRKIPWTYVEDVVGKDIVKKSKISHQGFNHNIYHPSPDAPNSEIYPMVLPMMENIRTLLENKYCYRARASMTLQTGERITQSPHVDFYAMPHNTAIYYMNDADGDTILYKEKTNGLPDYPKLENVTEHARIQPKANRLLLFNGEHYHTGESAVETSRRVLININFGDVEMHFTPGG